MGQAAVATLDPAATPPEPTNIVRALRLSHGLSVADLSNLADISPSAQTVVRTEQGTYRRIPEAVLRTLLHLDTYYTEGRLTSEYASYVTAKRRWSCETQPFAIYPLSEQYYDPRIHGHPLYYRRHQSGYPTLIGFCAAFCLHPSTLRRFESGKALTVPLQIRELLFDLDYGEPDINMLQSKHDDWLTHGRRIAQ